MKNKIINIAVVAEIAVALKKMKNDMIFVGGTVVSLYMDDPAVDGIRPTKDEAFFTHGPFLKTRNYSKLFKV